jgi:hypothetical protein
VHFEDAATLEAIFGRWPSFHDAEVLRINLDRAGSEGPTLEVVIYIFEMTKEVDAKGFYVLRHHTEVTLRFDGVSGLRLEAFNRQNVLSSLEIQRIARPGSDGQHFRVSMPSSYGLEADFECGRAIVAEVRPFNPAG